MAIAKRRGPPGALDPRDRVPVWPHLVYRELLWALIVFNALCIFSYFVDAPLESIADPTATPNPAKAPWYFLGLQELVHYSAFWGGVAAPGLLVLLLLLTPYVDRNPQGIGVWFHPTRRIAVVVFTILMLAVVALTLVGTFFRGEDWKWVWPW
jgi:quinol-cytochrome oxidoreductase complex cytochrome b subunit